jgi:hypothetical protein
MSWDQSSWTEETNFTGAVYGPAYQFGGGSSHSSLRISCGFYSTHSTSCSRGNINKHYSYDGANWSVGSNNAPASGSGGVGGGTEDDHYHTIKNYSGTSNMQLFSGDSWSTGGSHSYPNGSSNGTTQAGSVDTAQFGGRQGGSSYSSASTTISLYDR